MMETQTVVDEDKIATLNRLAVGMSISRPIILLHHDNDFCWLQFYMIKFLERDAYIFIEESERDDIQIFNLPDCMKIRYYRAEKDLMKKLTSSIKEYEKLLTNDLIEKK